MNRAIFTTKQLELVQYKLEGEESTDGEAVAALSLNPSYMWAKFILTDDKPNENKQRVPKEEFANLIKSGIFAPVKMMFGRINETHDEAHPLGVITHLRDIGDKIEGIAALWTREREEDVALIKDLVETGQYPQLSWEIMFDNSQTEEDGIETLKDTTLRGITLVSMPAYAGRTPIFAAASKNSAVEDIRVEELELLKKQLEDTNVGLAEKDAKVSELSAALEVKDSELIELREFKASVVKEREESEKLTAIKTRFSEAGLNKDESFFSEKKSLLLGLTEEALDFMVQEMISFASVTKETKASTKIELPNLSNLEDNAQYDDPKALGLALREKYIK